MSCRPLLLQGLRSGRELVLVWMLLPSAWHVYRMKDICCYLHPFPSSLLPLAMPGVQLKRTAAVVALVCAVAFQGFTYAGKQKAMPGLEVLRLPTCCAHHCISPCLPGLIAHTVVCCRIS